MSMLLSDAEVDQMRATLARTYPESVVIYKQDRTKDDSGGFTIEWDDQTPTVGRVAPLAGGVGAATAEVLMAGRLGLAEGWMLTVPAETNIDPPDRVLLNGDRGFEVASVLAPRTWELSRRVILVELS